MTTMEKFVLAYSGGLDTSIIIPWLHEHYSCEVICVCVNVGHIDDTDTMRRRAKQGGASTLIIVDARELFVTDYLYPMLRARAYYEEQYLLGTSIARPLQAAMQVHIAKQHNATTLVHGCTGKGNDQIRFELAYNILAPHLKIIAPWRVWDIDSREAAIDYATQRGISLGGISKTNIYSRDANLWHTSHEGGSIEDITHPTDDTIYQRTASADGGTPDEAEQVTIGFERAIPTAVNGGRLAPIELIATVNDIAARHGIGRIDLIESRVIGMKSRGLYETPGGTLLYFALLQIEMATLDKETRAAKRSLADLFGTLIYEGKWFSPLANAINSFMERAAVVVSGSVTLSLYKGTMTVVSRDVVRPLYHEQISSFDTGGYSNADAAGFVRLFSLPSQLQGQQLPTTVPVDKADISVYDL